MSGFGNGKIGSQLKSAINKDPKVKAPQAPSAAKAGADGMYIGDWDLGKVSFDSKLTPGQQGDASFTYLYDGKEVPGGLKLRLHKDPSDWLRQPFEAGPYIEKDKTKPNFGKVIDEKWTSQLDMSHTLLREKMMGFEVLMEKHVMANKDTPKFEEMGVPLTKFNIDPQTGDPKPNDGGAVPKIHSNIRYHSDPEKRKQFAPTFKIKVPHQQNDKGLGLPLIQTTDLIEDKKAITKRVTGSIQDLAREQLAICPVIRLSRGIYVGKVGCGASWVLDNALIISNKSGRQNQSIDIGGFEEMDETAEELAIKQELKSESEPFTADPDVPGMEGLANGAPAIAAEA